MDAHRAIGDNKMSDGLNDIFKNKIDSGPLNQEGIDAEIRASRKKNKPVEHIYYSKTVDPKVKLLCTDEWVEAENIRPERTHSADGYTINGTRCWSQGGGHNSTCPDCLIKLSEKRISSDTMLSQKLIDIAKAGREATKKLEEQGG